MVTESLPKPSPPARWHSGQALGYWLEHVAGDVQAYLSLPEEDFLQRNFVEPLNLWSISGPNMLALQRLPAGSLLGLTRLKTSWYPDLPNAARAAIRLLDAPGRDGISIIFMAKLIAHQLRSGTHTPVQILRSMKRMGHSMPPPEEQEKFEVLLQTLMTEASQTNYVFQRIMAALEPLTAEWAGSRLWPLVENSLLHGLFLWPMCVLKERRGVGSTLPLQLKVFHPELNAGYSDVGARIVHKGNRRVTNGKLRESLLYALRRALALWKNEFSNWDRNHGTRLDLTQVEIDLSHADRIRQLAGFAGYTVIDPESLEVDLALGILGRLLGDTAAEGLTATGQLGDPVTWRDHEHDTHIKNVGGVIEKAHRLGMSPEVEKLIFPSAWREDLQKHTSLPPTLALAFGGTLQEYANFAFPNSFTKHRFIRSHDLKLAYRNELGFLSADADLVLKCREAIEQSALPVLQLDPKIKGATVARAIFEMNQACGHYQRNVKFTNPGARKEDFIQSCVFIRATEYESGERFWHVVWEALTGSTRLDLPLAGEVKARSNGWGTFAWSLDRQASAEALARKLSRDEASVWEPKRTPDRIIIVGSRHLNKLGDVCPHGPLKRLELRGLLGPLQDSIHQIRDEYVTSQIGKARIILVSDDQVGNRPKVAISKVRAALKGDVRALRGFPNGFDFETARTALETDYWGAVSKISAIENEEIDGIPLLAVDKKRSSYVFNFDFVDLDEMPIAETKRLYRSGLALVGIAARLFEVGDSGTSSSSAYREILKPDRIHDSQHLLDLAGRSQLQLKPELRMPSIFKAVLRAKDWISRYGEPFSWSSVQYTSASRRGMKFDVGLKESVLDHFQRWRAPIHPIECMFAARLIWNEYTSLKNDRRRGDEEKNKLISQLLMVLDRAESDLEKLPHLRPGLVQFDERAACRFLIGSTMASLILQNEEDVYFSDFYGFRWGDRKGHALSDRSRRYFGWAADGMKAARDVISLEWFTYFGDFQRSEVQAMSSYAAAISNRISGLGLVGVEERMAVDPLVKFVGCDGAKTAIDWEVVRSKVKGFEGRHVAYLEQTDRPSVGLRDEYVNLRWYRGKERVLTMLGDKNR